MKSSESSDRLVMDALTKRFAAYKEMAQKAFAQISDAQLHQPLDQNTNSIAVIMKHMAGNLRSRFTDFLTTDGEKPDRDRDSEFIDDNAERKAILAYWETGWRCLFDAMSPLTDGDLNRTINIRGEELTVIDALLRQLAHHGYHVGQIVQLARFLAKDKWTVLTIPRGGSKQFNAAMDTHRKP
ncbi:MAG TPA: DUF1572 family protein [Tepidisphaeraceae bacterium]|jgi:uncharacterized damage-inducible protein DinB|nr:DUF1572 family protein [Tepidisphaeraceae bacterium]